MKIGILTFHRCINYGSYWQTFCLQQAIQERGHHTSILNHQSKRVNIAEWRCALQPVLPTPVPEKDRLLYREKIEKFLCMIEELPLSAPFPLEDSTKMDEYDLVIVGSDEVWNLSHPWYGYYPIFYGEGIRAKRLISYAASFGNYDSDWNLDQNWIRRLQLFDSISVRDESSQRIIQNHLGIETTIVLDPCLQFPSTIKGKKYPYKDRYAVIYGHNFSEIMIQNARKYAKSQKISLLSVGYRNDWADDQAIIADPREFAFLMSQSQAVITNFFHGCIFALINSKPFVCETSSYRSNKIQDLMKRIGGEKHLLPAFVSQIEFDSLLLNPLDESIYRNINSLRKISTKWLDHSLNLVTYDHQQN